VAHDSWEREKMRTVIPTRMKEMVRILTAARLRFFSRIFFRYRSGR
jgi:hypothetical protein